jgi:DNA polymerase-4
MREGMIQTERTILHIDMDAFFASVEQRCNPRLRGRAIAVTGSAKRTVVTTASYEARRYGVKTGMNRYEAARVCPGLIFVVGNNRKYIDTSIRILDILNDFSPKIEPYSIDEEFVEMTGSDLLFGPLRDTARVIKERIGHELGLTCSIGIAPNKLLAKLASHMDKPDGLVVIERDDIPGILEKLPVGEVWGIGKRLTAHLKEMGVERCGQLGRYPVSRLRRRFGIIGERLRLMGLGIDESPVVPVGEESEAKSVGHSTTLPRDISDRGVIRRYLLHLSEMVGRRARKYSLRGKRVTITVRYPDFYTFTRQKSLLLPTNDTDAILRSVLSLLDTVRLREAVRLLGVSISGLVTEYPQLPLFEEEVRRERLLETMDAVNDRFGDFTLTWGTLLERDRGAGVISPAWRPAGVKRVEVR